MVLGAAVVLRRGVQVVCDVVCVSGGLVDEGGAAKYCVYNVRLAIACESP